MSSSPLLPQSFWFRTGLSCPHVEALPRAKGRLLDLPDECLLPDFSRLEGLESWAEVRLAWNPKGLALAFEVRGKVSPITHDPTRPFASDGVQFWVDTRDTREVHRATRFCSRYLATLIPGSKQLQVELTRKPIARAAADPPPSDLSLARTQVDQIRGGWRVEIFLPAETIYGFDPETNRRLGFAYQVTDPDRGDQYLGVGREFPVGEDPSLWATLELRD